MPNHINGYAHVSTELEPELPLCDECQLTFADIPSAGRIHVTITIWTNFLGRTATWYACSEEHANELRGRINDAITTKP